MFMKKLVEKASRKQATGGGGISGLRPEEVKPVLAYHYGVPSGAMSMAYDPIQHILAIATKDGRIKLVGRDNTQALLQSESAVPSKFLQFIDNQGILLNVNLQNHIEVWNIDKKQLCHAFIFREEITSFSVLRQTPYVYVGDSLGNISVLKLDSDTRHMACMQYTIPFSESHGTRTGVSEDTAVIHILPQPTAETKRVLIIFINGLLSLWGLHESKIVFIGGGNIQQSSQHEPKKVVSACWACPFGSKVVVGYSGGDIFIWSIPVISDPKTIPGTKKKDIPDASKIPLLKLNLGYKMDKIPIVSLKWVAGDGRASRLYVNGFCDLGSYLFQVILLNEHSESRTIKLVLPLTEPCLGMETISCSGHRNKQKQNTLVLLLKSGCFCLYDDSEIEHYLLQFQSKSPPPVPNQLMVKLPYGNSSITIGKLYMGNSALSSKVEEEHVLLANKFSNLLSFDRKDANHINVACSSGLTKTRNLYITGHFDGAINFWDASCPLLLPLLSIERQTEESSSSTGSPVTALHFDNSSQLLISGDQNGMVRIIEFRKEQTTTENIISFLQAKQGSNFTVRSVKQKGAILSISINPDTKHLAVGTDKGFVSIVEMESATILYQRQFPSQLCTGIISLQFENCIHNGYEKNVLLVGVEDSSVVAIEEDTGNPLNTSAVHTKKPSKALLMKILDASSDGVCISSCQDMANDNSLKDNLQKQSLLLLCSESAVRLFSLTHVVQGIKKLYGKKRLSGSCSFASLVYSPSSNVGLMLLFASGKIEIRSLPDLTLLNETSLRGFMYPALKSHLNSSGSLCASSEGELIAVNGDKEMLFFSVLFQKDTYRYLEFISHIFKKDNIDGNAQKEKKKGLFGMVVKDSKESKSKHGQGTVLEDPGASTLDTLSALFSTANFSHEESRNSSVIAEDDDELDIDDIDLEDTQEKPKEQHIKGQSIGILSKKKLGKKFQAFKGRLIQKTDEKGNCSKEKHEDEKATGAIDQIKKRYGYSASIDSTAPKMAENKLRDNAKKLESIGIRSSEMQNTAQSFSSMAKELLQTVQKQEKNT